MLLQHYGFTRLVSATAWIISVAATLFCIAAANNGVSAQDRQTAPVARLSGSSSSTGLQERSEETPVSTANNDSNANATALSEADPIERRAFELVNAARMKNGLSELKWDDELYRVARSYSQQMGRRGFFSHISPEGTTPRDRLREAGLKTVRVVAENIAYNQGYDDPAGFAVERWMASAGHRENILSREFQVAAIGVFVNGEGCVYLTQLFVLR
jgi:uncharacterized protein YkwD